VIAHIAVVTMLRVYLLVPLILLIHARRLAVMGLSLHLSNLEPIA